MNVGLSGTKDDDLDHGQVMCAQKRKSCVGHRGEDLDWKGR